MAGSGRPPPGRPAPCRPAAVAGPVERMPRRCEGRCGRRLRQGARREVAPGRAMPASAGMSPARTDGLVGRNVRRCRTTSVLRRACAARTGGAASRVSIGGRGHASGRPPSSQGAGIRVANFNASSLGPHAIEFRGGERQARRHLPNQRQRDRAWRRTVMRRRLMPAGAALQGSPSASAAAASSGAWCATRALRQQRRRSSARPARPARIDLAARQHHELRVTSECRAGPTTRHPSRARLVGAARASGRGRRGRRSGYWLPTARGSRRTGEPRGGPARSAARGQRERADARGRQRRTLRHGGLPQGVGSSPLRASSK